MGEVGRLVARARDERLPIGERHAAFEELVRRHDEAALAWALRRVDDLDDARDAVQDAFIAAWSKLDSLREADAFGAWLKRLVATACRRRRTAREVAAPAAPAPPFERSEARRELARPLAQLPRDQLRAVVLFYFIGRTVDEIASLLSIPRGTVAKRLHSARLALRSALPPSTRARILTLRPSREFMKKIAAGVFDTYTGTYRFVERPDLTVRIVREGARLVSYGGDGQRNVLASLGDARLITTAFDGEGRFHRDRRGNVTEFVYYEFGRRLGVARRLSG